MEQESIYRMFDKRFSGYKEVPMALYGLGINTKYILEKAKDYNIIGIIANDRIGEYIYGKKVMPLEEIEGKVKVIVIVAQMKSVKTIYYRINHLEEKGIDIFDLFGEKVSDYIQDDKSESNYDPYWDMTYDKLRIEIDKHDSISFSIFDTLIMRRVPAQHHIWDIIERELQEKGLDIAFKAERLKAERQLAESGIVPGIEGIYDVMAVNAGIDEDLAHWLMKKEIETEKKYAAKRICMAEALEYARRQGKKIYILEDTCFSSQQIHELLLQCSIAVKTGNILVSSEIKKTKSDGTLYDYYIKYAGKGSKLHIGSSQNSDIKAAAQLGIDTFYIMSAHEMLIKSSANNIISYAADINDYVMLGLFAARAFNDPFALSDTKGKLRIENMYDLGYYCFAPVTLKFLIWITGKLRNDDKSIVLFSSRDGYLLYELYRYLRSKYPSLKIPEGVYFYISRRAVTVAAIRTEDDIADIVQSVFKLSIGNVREILEQRLGVGFNKGDSILNRSLMDVKGENDKKLIVEKVLEYKDEILRNASEERSRYLKYIQNNTICAYDRIYLFDLYTRGTSMDKLSSLIGKEVELLCYAVKDFPNEYVSSMDKASSMLDSADTLPGEWFRKSYQLFEVIYSSPDGQLKCFDNEGKPQFISGSEYNYSYIKDAQTGISDFAYDLESLDEEWYKHDISLKMADSMAGMMRRKYSVPSEDIRKGFAYYDSFASEAVMNIWDSII